MNVDLDRSRTANPLPAPRNAKEQARKRAQAIVRFELDQAQSWACVDSVLNLAYAFFNKPVFASVVHADHVTFIGSKESPYQCGREAPIEGNLCALTVAQPDLSEPFEVQDRSKDARFSALEGLPAYYIGMPITLKPGGGEAEVAVCSLCVHADEPGQMNEAQKEFLRHLGSILQNAFENRWHRLRQAKSLKMESFIQDLLSFSTTVTSPQSNASRKVDFQLVAKQVRQLVEADLVTILDLSQFESVWSRVLPTPEADSFDAGSSWLGHQSRSTLEESGRALVLANDMAPSTSAIAVDFNAPLPLHALAAFLKSFARHGAPADVDGPPSGPLRILFPSSTEAHIAVPVYSLGSVNLIIFVSSETPHRRFEPEDSTFVSNVAVLLQGHLMSRQLLEADRAKTHFVSSVSHELRTPLYGLLSQLELLRECIPQADLPDIVPLLETAEECGVTLRDILNDVLDFGKMQNNKQINASEELTNPEEGQQVNLISLMTEVLSMAYTRRKRMHFVTGEQKPLPELVSIVEEPWDSWIVLGVDAPSLRRILLNLVSNSLKYTPEGSILVTLKQLATPTKLENQGLSLIQLSCKDSGVGMSEEFQRKLFTPFAQENQFSPGAGLGLNIVDGLVRKLGGDCQITSTLSVGTEVRLNLPVRLVKKRPYSPVHAESRLKLYRSSWDANKMDINPRSSFGLNSRTPSPRPSVPNSPMQTTFSVNGHAPHIQSRLRILVADDNVISRRILTTLLTRRGLKFQEAEDGLQALAQFKEYAPNLVITDISMPNMDGLESARQMRLIEAELKRDPAYIVALTGLSYENHSRELVGINEWLTKGQDNLKNIKVVIDRAEKRFS